MIITKWKYYTDLQGSWRLAPHGFAVAGSDGISTVSVGYDYLQQSSDYKHYVGTYTQQDNFIRYYENGVLIDSALGASGSIFVSNSKILIGAAIYLYLYYFNGDIDDIRIYDRALTEEEIIALYNEITSVQSYNPTIPGSYSLEQNYPNPFNSSSIIKYSIPKSSQISLKIFNTLGEELETLVNEEKPVGEYEVDFNSKGLTSGIYFYRLQAVDPESSSGQVFVETKKMILLR